MDLEKFKGKYEVKQVKENLNHVNQNPLVSVCVQTYNHVDYIKQCLDGILFQKTNFEFEILLGEDDSIDGTRELCEDYAKCYPDKIRLFLHHRENNIKIGGQPTGRFNFLYNLHSSQGKYIALCEGDDYWTDPLKLQKQIDFLEGNEGYSMCFHRVQLLINEKLEKDTITRKVPQTTSTSDLLKGNFIHTPSVVFRNHFDEENLAFFLKSIQFSPIGDLPLHVYNSQYGKIYQIPESMAVYRLGSGIWSVKKKSERIQSTIRAYICLAAFLKTQSDFDYLYKNIEIYFHQLHKLRQPIKPNEASFKDLSKALMRKVKKKFLS
jgi:glycosyltransferase involved in cell wall biosynthesis